jgi:hypothetical protein
MSLYQQLWSRCHLVGNCLEILRLEPTLDTWKLANSSKDTFEAQHGVEYDANLS